ncbi:hypothetical protein Y1Q_0009084 [Alligator mississippiensis]|uniref:Uncharacterized protein n=1 Tax=Alligator mississippiensis TaxID=8496 RepID=A0A151M266_ALLMI|nr:hypothetical protein Y1Q_0009084 [Alligator mississippiensis]
MKIHTWALEQQKLYKKQVFLQNLNTATSSTNRIMGATLLVLANRHHIPSISRAPAKSLFVDMIEDLRLPKKFRVFVASGPQFLYSKLQDQTQQSYLPVNVYRCCRIYRLITMMEQHSSVLVTQGILSIYYLPE